MSDAALSGSGDTLTSIKLEVEEFYRAYLAAFDRRDLEAIERDVLADPSVEVTLDGAILVRSVDEFLDAFRAGFAAFEQEGWDAHQLNEIKVFPISPNVAIVSQVNTRMNEHGEAIDSPTRGAVYFMRRSDSGWRIAAYSYIAAGFPAL